jgi:hypothetical protein
MSCYPRAERFWAHAVRVRNAGAKPTLTSANAPFFKNTRREIMMASLRAESVYRAATLNAEDASAQRNL